jgi:hypothetical protein
MKIMRVILDGNENENEKRELEAIHQLSKKDVWLYW